MSDKIGSFRIIPLLKRNSEHAEFIRSTTEYIKSLNLPKKPASTVQCASTQATLDRDPSKDAEHWSRPLPESVVLASKIQRAAYETGDLNELERLLSTRKIRPDEASHIESVRRRPKNSLGQSDLPTADKAKIERAIHAFTYSGPAELTPEQKQRLAELTAYSQLAASFEREPVTQPKPTLLQKIKAMFKISPDPKKPRSLWNSMSEARRAEWAGVLPTNDKKSESD